MSKSRRVKKVKVVSFKEFLRVVIGIDWNDFDENYSNAQANEIWGEYYDYCEAPQDYTKYFTENR